MVSAQDFVAAVEWIRNSHVVKYANGESGRKSGDLYLCDCRGYILWALRKIGLKASSIGTNWMIRKQVRDVQELKDVSQLQPGMLVFKKRGPMESGYSLPSRYKEADFDPGIGLDDVYHVGIVVSVAPLLIRHCTSGGIKTDKVLGKWSMCAWHESVSDEPVQGTMCVVTAPKGKTVNLRNTPSSVAKILVRVPIGSVVATYSTEGLWSFIDYDGTKGYMMTEFLEVVPDA